MVYIPKKVLERFKTNIPKFQRVLKVAKDKDVNESDTVSVINDILGEVFGYDKYIEVTSEFAIRGTYCDLAIKVDEKVQFLLEAKAIGIELKESHMKQACDYGANHGVQWVILTNGVTWNIYRIRFEKPINFDLVCSFEFQDLNLKSEKYQEILFMLSREGLEKELREEYFERVQNVNKYVIGNLLMAEPILNLVRRELKKLADGTKVEIDEIEEILETQVLKREIVDSEAAQAAQQKVAKFYKQKPKKKSSSPTVKKETEPEQDTEECNPEMSVTERLLQEAGSTEN